MSELKVIEGVEETHPLMRIDKQSIANFLQDYYGDETPQVLAIEAIFKMKAVPKVITVDEIEKYNNNGFGIYFSVNAVKDGLSKKAGKKDITKVIYAHVDIDPKVNGIYSEELRIKILELADDVECTFAIDSGNGIGLYWRLEDGVSVEDVEAINLALMDKYEEYGADRGTHNIERIMRLPFTLNHPTENKLKQGYSQDPVPSNLIKSTGAVFNSKDFEKLYKAERDLIDIDNVTETLLPVEITKSILDDIELINIDDMSTIDYAFVKDYIRGARAHKIDFIPTIKQLREVIALKGMYELREELSPSNKEKYEREAYLSSTISKVVNELDEDEGFDNLDEYEDAPITLEMLYEIGVAVDYKATDLKPLDEKSIIFDRGLHLFFAPSGYFKSFTVAKIVEGINKDKFYFDFEQNPSVLKAHCESLGVTYVTPPNTMKELEILLATKADCSNALFIFDSFSNLIAEGNNDATDTANIVKLMHKLCTDRGATVIFIDHATKINYIVPASSEKDWNFKLEGNESGKKKPCELVYMIQPVDIEDFNSGVKLLVTKSRTPLRRVNEIINLNDVEFDDEQF